MTALGSSPDAFAELRICKTGGREPGVRRVRAAVLHEPGQPLVVEDVLLEPPRAREVLVRVAAAGVCHSDLHLAEGHLGRGRWPTVLGHEGAGVVEAVGEGVSEVGPGARVGFCFVPSCGNCPPCRAGRRNLCVPAADRSRDGTLLDGTSRLRLPDGRRLQHFLLASCFAERCVVPVGSAVPLPAGLPLWEAALLGCGVVTGFGAVRRAAKVAPGESVAVVGCGGVGLQVIAAAHFVGAHPVIAIDRHPAKLQRALEAGATDALAADGESLVDEVLARTGGGVDHAFEVVGRPETVRTTWSLLRPAATAVVVGVVPEGLDVSVPGIDLLTEKGLKGSYYGSGDPAGDLAELARLAAERRIDPGRAVSDLTDLEGVQPAFDRLRRGDGARTVVLLDPQLAGAPA